MAPELAVGLPAAGSVCAAILRARPRAALLAAAILGFLGMAALVLSQPGRTSDHDLTLYKSTGHAVEDAAAASLVYARALAEGAGRRLPL